MSFAKDILEAILHEMADDDSGGEWICTEDGIDYRIEVVEDDFQVAPVGEDGELDLSKARRFVIDVKEIGT